jgi:hypothetical protein
MLGWRGWSMAAVADSRKDSAEALDFAVVVACALLLVPLLLCVFWLRFTSEFLNVIK